MFKSRNPVCGIWIGPAGCIYEGVGDTVVKALPVEVQVRLPDLLTGSVWSLWRILMRGAVQIETRQHNNAPRSGLILQAHTAASPTLNRQEKLLSPISRMKNAIVIHGLSEAEIERTRINEDLGHFQQSIGLSLRQWHRE